MNQTIKNIFLLILSIIVCWFLMLGSFIFAWEDDMVDFQESDHKWYAAKITQPWTDQASLSQKEINLRTQSLKQNTCDCKFLTTCFLLVLVSWVNPKKCSCPEWNWCYCFGWCWNRFSLWSLCTLSYSFGSMIFSIRSDY